MQNVNNPTKEWSIDDIDISINDKNDLKDLKADYSSIHTVFLNPEDLVEFSIYNAKLNLKPDPTPVWIPSRKIPYHLQDAMDSEIEKMEKSGIIEKCSYSLWSSPIFLVKKKNDGYRFVADMRSVNSKIASDNFELPNLGNILDNITEFKYLSSFDFTSSFSQIPLESENDRNIMAFTYNNVRYRFARMVQGCKTSTAQWSRFMQKLFAKIPFKNLLYFVDDLLLTSNTVKDHLHRLRYLLERISYANMRLSPSKCRLFCESLKFVGLKLSSRGIEIDEDRIKAIKNLEPPVNVKQLHKALGVFGFNRKFIDKYASISKPLYALLRKNTRFKWDKKCQEAFDTLKNKIINAPVLGLPDIKDPHNSYHVYCDASARGFGGYLSQLINGERKIIAYYSKSVPKHQANWPATKLEFVGLYHCLKNWKIYLQGARKFKVFTDCKALLNFDTIFSKGNAAMQRKLANLSGFNMEIVHISGESNIISDALSRYPYENATKMWELRQILRKRRLLQSQEAEKILITIVKNLQTKKLNKISSNQSPWMK